MARCAVPRAGLLSEAASDQWLLYTVLTAAASVGYRLGVTTRLGRLATGPICAMGLTFVAAGAGVLPPASAQVSAAQGLAVRIATPLLLFGANLRAIASRAGRLLPSFMLGSLGTALVRVRVRARVRVRVRVRVSPGPWWLELLVSGLPT